MSEDKKKKVYIGIIIACVVGTIGVVFFMQSGGSVPVLPPDDLPLVTDETAAPRTPTVTSTIGMDPMLVNYTAPAVFPADNKFNTTVLSSSAYQSLNDYQPLTVSP
ncbi:MAG TPA: hypothetical protein VD998_04390, partial [Verrucomicrobiae bacterium]|nr:hypothetical protein [Verrucomicrobiae bacterium]